MENSKIIKNVLSSIISISGRKTNQSHAIFLIESTLNTLKKQYSFLENINVKDTTYIEDEEQISIMTEVNKVNKHEMGVAVKDIITHLNLSLGDEAGHFFLKELSHKLNDESIVTLKNMGVDLDFMHLEKQVSKMEKEILK